MSRLNELLNEIRELEEHVTEELGREADELGYSIKKGKVRFEKEISRHHREFSKKLGDYLAECSWLGLLVSPLVYSLIIPVFIFDVFILFYQLICFPVYNIPKVRRRDYIAIDHHKLRYLNLIERFNCVYCSYANGFIAYAQEVAARSEMYWCPIKHARKLKHTHSHYADFLSYGNAEGYTEDLNRLKEQLKALNK